ncbi:hypothetical protein GGI42DRAFT_98717 [Trichoderma sp. SZMC 28013]
MNEVPRRATLSISLGIRQETHSIKLLSLFALLPMLTATHATTGQNLQGNSDVGDPSIGVLCSPARASDPCLPARSISIFLGGDLGERGHTSAGTHCLRE